jgi:outer membrane protein
VNNKNLAILLAGTALLAPGLASAECQTTENHWAVRIGGHDIRPTEDNNPLAGGTVIAGVKSKFGPTVNLDYRFCKIFVVDVLGAIPFTQQINLNHQQLASTRHLPPTVTLQWHPRGESDVDPFLGVGVNRTFFFNESLNGPLAGNNLQLSNTWGYTFQGGIDFKISGPWFAGIDMRYIQIEPNASLNGAAIGRVKIDPMVYGFTIGYHL